MWKPSSSHASIEKGEGERRGEENSLESIQLVEAARPGSASSHETP